MSDLSTLTLRLPRATTDKLERLAGQRHTTRDALVGQALADFVDRELAVIASIERGLAEIQAGLGLETDDVFGDVEAAIVAAEAGRTEP